MFPATSLDVLTIGRSGVDLYPLQSGVGLADVTTFGKFLGGSPTNVAVAASRLGHSASVVTAVGADPFGVFVRRSLREMGVDDAHVVEIAGARTSVTFCELFPPDDFPLWFYRDTPAPDLQISTSDLDLMAVSAARVLWLTTSGLSAPPSRDAHAAALARRGAHGTFTILDLDYRPAFWSSPDAAARAINDALPWVDVVVGNERECEIATGYADPDRAATALLDRGAALSIVKQGSRGLIARTSDHRVELPAFDVPVLNGLGAGDGFGGALCHGLLVGWSLERTLIAASASGAIVASRLECANAMPTLQEIEILIDGSGSYPDWEVR